jgi:hypothetical protein
MAYTLVPTMRVVPLKQASFGLTTALLATKIKQAFG